MPSPAAELRPLPDPVARVERIAALLAASSERNEELGRLAPEVLDALHAARLFRLLLPRAYGGEEIDPPTFFRVMEAIARQDASTAWCIGQANGCAMVAAYLDPAAAHQIWDEPRAVLSWGPPGASRADAVDGGWRVSGRWSFGSGCRHSSWIGLQCPAFDRDGRPARLAGSGSVLTLLVPASRVQFEDTWDVLGLKATASDSWTVQDLVVPSTFGVCREAVPERRLDGPLYKLPAMSLYAIGFSAVALGVARGLLDDVLALARSKTQRNIKIALRDNHAVQTEMAEAEARLRSSRIYVETTARQVWEEVVRTGTLTNAQRMDIRLASTHAIHEAKRAADLAYDAAGASAIARSSGMERRFRDLHTVTQQVQGRRINLQAVGATLLGHEPDMTWA